jgi:hypothetical protein
VLTALHVLHVLHVLTVLHVPASPSLPAGSRDHVLAVEAHGRGLLSQLVWV